MNSRRNVLDTIIEANSQQTSDTDNENSPINKLTDDDLIMIFSYLNIHDRLNFEKVCRRWTAVSRVGWYDTKSLHLKYPDYNHVEVEDILKRCGKFLVEVITPIKCVTSCNMKFIGERCRRLKTLVLQFDPWAFRPVLQDYGKRFAKSLPKLQKLESLLMYDVNSISSTAELSVIAVANLKRLKISGTPSTKTCCILSADISRFRTLQSLSINYTRIKENKGLIRLEKLQNLIELNLSYCEIPENDIEKIQRLKRLEVLQLAQGPTKINDRQISEIATSCVNLKFLRLDGLADLTDVCFEKIANLQNLEVLYMNGLPLVTNGSIALLNQLFILSCDNCSGITTDGLKFLIETSQKINEISCRETSADVDEIGRCLDEAISQRKHSYQMTLDLDAIDEIVPIPEKPLFT